MLFSFEWLKQYVSTKLTATEAAERLTMAGVEVESVVRAGKGISSVITAEILKVNKHPNADRLRLCDVKTKDKEFSIVCGASNMKDGDKVALALDGATLPGGVTLKKTKIRGIESQGMMCSEVELGIADKSEGIMILPADTPIGEDINDVLALNDDILDVSILPNRADCLSVVGLAREIAAVAGEKFAVKETKLKESKKKAKDSLKVEIKATKLCGRYSARVIEGVKVGASPLWLKRRLEKLGLRSINNIVDVTNYVMLELGQPLHAFDLSKLKGQKIIVREAKPGEKITTLDGKERDLKPGMLAICDGEGPEAVAGIMGGAGSEVTDSTTTIALESAYFDPASVRNTSRALGLSSDSSYRFERGVDIEGVTAALDRAAALIHELAGGEVLFGQIDEYPEKHKPVTIEFDLDRASALLGLELVEKDVTAVFERLGIEVGKKAKGALSCAAPSFRRDITMEADLAEEAARIIGYDKIAARDPLAPVKAPALPSGSNLRRRLSRALTSLGFYEAVNLSFVSEKIYKIGGRGVDKAVKVLNPITEDHVYMRASLTPSLLENLKFNLSRKNENVRLFEMRPVFVPSGCAATAPTERLTLAAVMHGARFGGEWSSPKENVDFFDAKGVLDRALCSIGIEASYEPYGEDRLYHPGKCALLKAGEKTIGTVGELHPDIQAKYDFLTTPVLFEIDLDAAFAVCGALRKYNTLTKFPGSERDIAFVVAEDVRYGDIRTAIIALDTKLIENIELFDVYYGQNIGAGKKSLAIRLSYRALDRTLKAEEVDEVNAVVVGMLKDKFGAEVRM
ncbi:MAG: phenylalanine--tRNA ligase subunit beta [Deltaproteobacteria bacterium]|nr:phenylalanine--tRNA ligase subunit beta [Deltaproteobacteria bacterium]